MRMRLLEGRALSAVVVVSVLLGGVGAGVGSAIVASKRGHDAGNLDRFAALTFGERAARAALDAASAPHAEAADEDEGPPSAPDTPLTFSEYRTPNGWLLRPAGRQVDTDRAPTGFAVAPDAKTVVAVASGTAKEFMTVVDATTLARTEFPTSDMYMGAAINEDGYLWVSTGSRNRVMLFKLLGPVAAGLRPTTLFPGTPNIAVPVIGYPGNMVLTSDDLLLVAGNLSVPNGAIPGGNCASSTICSVINVLDVSDPVNSTVVDYIEVGRDAFGLALNEAKGKLYVTNWADETNPARGGGTGTVSVVNLAPIPPDPRAEVQVIPVGHHPTGIVLAPDGKSLFVANSADDTISRLELDENGMVVPGGTETKDVRVAEDAPKGATPLALSFTRTGSQLLVGLAGQNAIEVRTPTGAPIPRAVQVGGRTLHLPHTYIPTGWWPSAMAAADHPTDPAKTRLYLTNLKGIGAGLGYNVYAPPGSGVRTQGTLQVIDIPGDEAALEARLDQWTATVVENNNWGPIFDTELQDAAADPCLPAPLPGGETRSQFLCDESKVTGPSPYHVVFVVKENKTFDQFFGDIAALGLPDADADPTFLLYGEPVTTNQHNLARAFTLGDNFWADSEQSTTGHRWTSAGYVNEFVEITWNPEYAEGLRGSRRGGQYSNQEPTSFGRAIGPFAGARDPEIGRQEGELAEPEERLVDLMTDPATNPRGVTFRVYSDDVNDDSVAEQCCQVPLQLWGLRPSTFHRGRDLDFPDTDRANIFIQGETIAHSWSLDQGPPPSGFGQRIAFTPGDRAKFALVAWVEEYQACMARRPPEADDSDCQSSMPNFLYMALPVDHTLGFNPLAPTPASMVADNDYATGLVVEALSKSPFWKNTLILITEDDTQLAGDHVDSHRTFLLATGGLARTYRQDEQKVSHQAGSFPSILKTVEVLFGLPSLTIYDRAAVPLHDFVVDDLKDQNTVVYEAVKPAVPFLRNPQEGELATLSSYIDWRLDHADSDLLSAMFYYGEKGWPLPARYRRLIERGPARN